MLSLSQKSPGACRPNLLDFTLPGLESLLAGLGQPAFRATQIWQWLWRNMARDFNSMSNVSKSLRAWLADNCAIVWPEVAAVSKGLDGTTKFLLRFLDGECCETVLIPSVNRVGETRWTQCLSSQIGCPMRCAFCATGQMGFRRNMTMGEIMAQVLVARDYLDDRRLDWPVLRNLVFMGMGEPLLNMRALLPALRSMSHPLGLNFSARRMTVSTCGIRDGLRTLGESGLAYLAVSLHAPTQELREQIMPGAAQWPLPEMLAALQSYPLKTRERITFEYLLLGGVNDSISDAKGVARIVSAIKGKLNLIIYNPSPGLPFAAPEAARVEAFQKYLYDRNITTIIRKSKGADIAAACGQLRAEVCGNS